MASFRNVSFYLFLGTMLLAPLPFASNRPWSWSLLSALIGIYLILEIITSSHDWDEQKLFLKRMLPGFVLWIGVALWAFLQTVPWMPDGWAHPLWTDAADILDSHVVRTISIDPQATLEALTRFLSYGAVFWISASYCRKYEQAEIVLKAFVFSSIAYAVYGLIIFFSGTEMILWFDKWAYRGNLTSTFVNRNSYATFAGIGIIASTAYAFHIISSNLRSYLNARELIRSFIEAVYRKAWVPFLGGVIIATALLLTHSRGGFLSTSVAFLVLLIGLYYIKAIPKTFVWVLMGVAVVGAIFAFSMSGDITIDRISKTSFDTSVRDEVYQRTNDAISANPMLGTGYGTYEKAFMAYKIPALSSSTWDKAHNSYLELAMELGIPATLAVAVAFLWAFMVCLSGVIKRRRRRIFSVIGMAITVLVAAHALVDFSLQIPGFTVSYAILMGMAWGQSWTSEQKRKKNRNPAEETNAT